MSSHIVISKKEFSRNKFDCSISAIISDSEIEVVPFSWVTI